MYARWTFFVRCTAVLYNVLQGRNVLKKEPMGKDISETDVFSFNEEFHNKLYKIKIATVSAQKESEPEKIETRHKVSQHDWDCC